MDTHCRNFPSKIAAESGRSGRPILLLEPASITYSLRSKFSEICERYRLVSRFCPKRTTGLSPGFGFNPGEYAHSRRHLQQRSCVLRQPRAKPGEALGRGQNSRAALKARDDSVIK